MSEEAQLAPSEMIPYVLTGSMKGRSGKFLGQTFTKGKALVPKDVHVAVGHVLRQDFAAIPQYEFEEKERLNRGKKAHEDKSKAITELTPAIKPEEPVDVPEEDIAEEEDIPEDVPEPDSEEPAPKKRGKK